MTGILWTAAVSVLWKGTALLALTAAATALLRRAPASVRHAVWFAAIMGVPAVAVLSLSGPFLPIRAALPAVRLPIQAPSRPLQAAAREGTAVPTDPSRAGPAPSALLLPFWLAGTAAFLAREAAARHALRSLKRDAAAVPGTFSARLEAWAGRNGFHGRPRLAASGRCRVPMAFGILDPAILLPADLLAEPEDRQRPILLHEMAHVERRDALTDFLARLVGALFWFHPLLHFALRRLRIESEMACDALAASSRGDGMLLAEALLARARAYRGPLAPTGQSIAWGGSRVTKERIHALVHSEKKGGRNMRHAAVLAWSLAVAILLVPVSFLRAENGPGASGTGSRGTWLRYPKTWEEQMASVGFDYGYPLVPSSKTGNTQASSIFYSGDASYAVRIRITKTVIGTIADAPVLAVTAGTVLRMGRAEDIGNYIVLGHEDGGATRYGNLGLFAVESGVKVMRGDQIATVGKEGDSEPRLQLEIRYPDWKGVPWE